MSSAAFRAALQQMDAVARERDRLREDRNALAVACSAVVAASENSEPLGDMAVAVDMCRQALGDPS